jgi:tripartite-type tricarboxylate transporter receptor subunit TctC
MSKMNSFTRRALLAGSALAPALLAGRAHAQTALPDKGLDFLVGFAANDGTDTIARSIAGPIERRVGRRVTVQNRPGNAGATPGELVKKGLSDGSTLAFLSSTTLVSRLLAPDFPFDPFTDLSAISLAGTWPIGFAVSPKIDVRTFDEYLRYLRVDDPNRLKLGSTTGSGFIETFSRMVGKSLGVSFESAPFRGAQPLVNDLSEGRIPAAVAAMVSVIEPHRGKRVRLLMTTSPRRLAVAPDVPTARELGYPGLEDLEWFAFYASAKTPAPLIAEWNHQIRAALGDGDLVSRLAQSGLTVETTSPQQTSKRLTSHLAVWKKNMIDVGLKPI